MPAPLHRHLTDVVHALLDEFRVVVVTGARQVGKSTLARAVLDRRPGAYVTLDLPDALERAIADPLGLVDAQRSHGGLTVIDEVQLAPQLLRAVKLAVDRDERPGAFLLTGSANLLRMRTVSETLAGRAAYVELGPLTLTERLGQPPPRTIDDAFGASTAEEFVARLPTAAADAGAAPALRDSLLSAVVAGGMPGTLHMDTTARRHWYSAYVSTFVERDLWQLGRVDDVLAFRRLFTLAMLRTGGLLNRSDLAADAALDHRTSTRYMDMLDVGYQLRTLTPYAASRGKRLVKMPKVFARDSGMAAHLMRVDSWDSACEIAAAGALFETWMLGEILAIDSVGAAPSSAHFWRTSAGSEVDLLLERGTELVGVEMKAGATVRWSDTRALAAVRDGFGDRFRMGIIAYLGDEVRVLDDRICAVPAWSLLGVGEAAALLAEELRAPYAARPGAALVTGRAMRGVRVQEVATLLGVDEATVEHWERTAYEDAPLSVVRRLAEEFGVVVQLG
ncbi:MAG: AAA family ATPase [Actinomycetota bacterium]|nr:AAA family ATPase [Actinomycetota bacterium]